MATLWFRWTVAPWCSAALEPEWGGVCPLWGLLRCLLLAPGFWWWYLLCLSRQAPSLALLRCLEYSSLFTWLLEGSGSGGSGPAENQFFFFGLKPSSNLSRSSVLFIRWYTGGTYLSISLICCSFISIILAVLFFGGFFFKLTAGVSKDSSPPSKSSLLFSLYIVLMESLRLLFCEAFVTFLRLSSSMLIWISYPMLEVSPADKTFCDVSFGMTVWGVLLDEADFWCPSNLQQCPVQKFQSSEKIWQHMNMNS